MSYTLNSKKVLLTWPSSPSLSLDSLLLHIKNVRQPSYVVVSRELHQDGTPHFHAYVEFGERVCIRDARRKYTCDAREPNITTQKYGKSSKLIEYVKKEGDYKEEGEPGAEAKSRGARFVELLGSSGNAESFKRELLCDPTLAWDAVRAWSSVSTFAEYKFRPSGQESTYETAEFRTPETLQEWVQENLVGKNDKQ